MSKKQDYDADLDIDEEQDEDETKAKRGAAEANKETNQRRLDVLDRIANANYENDKNDYDFGDEGASEEDTAEDNTDDVSEEEIEDEAPAKIVRKINGKEVEITDEMIEKAMKVASADKYLEDAKVSKNANPPPSQRDVVETDENIDWAQTVRAIQMGSEDEAIESLKSLVGKKPSINVDVLTKQVTAEIDAKNAVEKFKEEFPEIVSNPMLANMAMQEDARLREEGFTGSFIERYREAGKAVRGQVSQLAGSLGFKPAESPKQHKKDSLPKTPKSSGSRPAAQVDDEDGGGEENQSDLIRQLAKRRGQYM